MKEIKQNPYRVKLLFFQTLYSQSAASVTMGSLAAYLRSFGFKIDLCLLDHKNIQNVEKILGHSDYGNIIIAKPNFKDFRSMFSLLERLKKNGQANRIFLCGPFAKINAQDIMVKLKWLDGIFIDQIEIAAMRLLSTISQNLMSWNVLSLGTISRNPATGDVCKFEHLTDCISLSKLPFPARDIETRENVSYVNIEASRGCLFNCSFCHVPLMHERSVKNGAINARDPKLVVEEIYQLNKRLGKTLFIFNDSCFWSTSKDNPRIINFCKEISRKKLDVRFYIYLRGEPFVSDDILNALAKAGLVRVFLGVENVKKSSLIVYNKKIKPDMYSTIKSKLDQLGINIHIGYVTIEPYSSLADVLSNIEYLFRIGKLFRLGVILEPVRIVPGSSLHTRLVAEKLMLPNLRYDEITYGYTFKHKEVGLLLLQWKKMFENILENVSGDFEYYATAGELLRVLSERLDTKFTSLLRPYYTVFNAKKLQGMDLLARYFKESIKLAKNQKIHPIGDPQYNRDFIDGFALITNELKLIFGDIVFTVKNNGGARAIKELYTH